MDPTLAAQWAPKGCQPQLFSDSTRERVNLCGIVDIDTMDARVQKIPKGNAESFIAMGMGSGNGVRLRYFAIT